jgi:phage-related protein
MSPLHKQVVWLSGKPTTPPLSNVARVEVGYLLRLVQAGMLLSMPKNKPMPRMGKNCHELRVNDENVTWRFYYRIDSDFIVCAEWNCKKTEQTSQSTIELCKNRFKVYDSKTGGSK